jgi:hypothetical protein
MFARTRRRCPGMVTFTLVVDVERGEYPAAHFDEALRALTNTVADHFPYLEPVTESVWRGPTT